MLYNNTTIIKVKIRPGFPLEDQKPFRQIALPRSFQKGKMKNPAPLEAVVSSRVICSQGGNQAMTILVDQRRASPQRVQQKWGQPHCQLTGRILWPAKERGWLNEPLLRNRGSNVALPEGVDCSLTGENGLRFVPLKQQSLGDLGDTVQDRARACVLTLVCFSAWL